jgi:hypothetical protein
MRSRMGSVQSGIFVSGNAADGLDEGLPPVAALDEHFAAGGSESVIAATALSGFFDPAALNPAAVLEAVEERVEGGDAEFDGAAGAGFDELGDFVTVALLCFEKGEDEEFGAAFFEIAVETLFRHIWVNDILDGNGRQGLAWMP